MATYYPLQSKLSSWPLGVIFQLKRVSFYTKLIVKQFSLIYSNVQLKQAPQSFALIPHLNTGSINVLRLTAKPCLTATQSSTLQSLLTQFAATTTRAGQMALIDQLLDAWADASPTRRCEHSEAIQTHLERSKDMPCNPISMRLPEHAFECSNRAEAAIFNFNTTKTQINDAEWRMAA